LRLFLLVGGLISLGMASCIAPSGGVFPLPGAATPTESPSTADQSDVTSIRDVIQRANSEQEQAIASRDSSPMRDTSTERYYRDMVRINQDLLDNGVTSIKLEQIEWGTVDVTGNFAQAITTESWATTTSDGRTGRSRERNLYRLVRDGTSWKIDADDHPDSNPNVVPPFRTGPEV